MTLKTIRDPILRDLGLSVDSALNDDARSRIDDYINEVIADLSIISWDIGKTNGSITLVDGTDIYSLESDADVGRIADGKFYFVSDAERVERLSDEDFIVQILEAETGLPKFWRPFGKDANEYWQIQVRPTPGSAENGKTMEYEYSKTLASLTNDSDTSEFHENIIRHFVKARYYEYDQDFNKADRQEARAQRLLSRVLAQKRLGQRFKPLTRRNHTSGD